MRKETPYLFCKIKEISDKKDFLPEGKFTVLVDFPLEKGHEHKFTVRGPLSIDELTIKVAKEYKNIFRHHKNDIEKGHKIGDLVIHGMCLDTVKKTVTLGIRSGGTFTLAKRYLND